MFCIRFSRFVENFAKVLSLSNLTFTVMNRLIHFDLIFWVFSILYKNCYWKNSPEVWLLQTMEGFYNYCKQFQRQGSIFGIKLILEYFLIWFDLLRRRRTSCNKYIFLLTRKILLQDLRRLCLEGVQSQVCSWVYSIRSDRLSMAVLIGKMWWGSIRPNQLSCYSTCPCRCLWDILHIPHLQNKIFLK